MGRNDWSRSELIVAFNLYCKIPFGKIHNKNPEIISLAKLLGRTPSALSWKLANFASLDPALKARNIVGAIHGNKIEREIWAEFSDDWEQLSFESEILRLEMAGKSSVIEEGNRVFPEGQTRDAVVRVRVNQGFFRAAVLSAYDSKCCITGLAVADLLCASHILPWSQDLKNRTNPRNGLCLNAIHDRAFDRGLLTINQEHKVLISPRIRLVTGTGIEELIHRYDGAKMVLPSRFAPDDSFLEYHRSHIFQG